MAFKVTATITCDSCGVIKTFIQTPSRVSDEILSLWVPDGWQELEMSKGRYVHYCPKCRTEEQGGPWTEVKEEIIHE